MRKRRLISPALEDAYRIQINELVPTGLLNPGKLIPDRKTVSA